MKPIKKLLSIVLSLAMIAGFTFSGPAVTARAAEFSVTSSFSQDLTQQVFTISNPGGEALWYDVEKDQQMVQTNVPVTSNTIAFPDIHSFYAVYVYNENRDEVSEVSPVAHNYSVSYNIEGTMIAAETGEIVQGDSFTFDADEYYTYNGKEYRVQGGASQIVYFGKSDYVFHYSLYEPEPVTAVVHYVDTSGNEIGSESKPVTYYGGNVTFDVPAAVSYDGRDYMKVSQTNTVSVNYYSPQLEYDIVYQMKDAPQEGPYSIEVVYQSEDGIFLGNQYYTVDPKDALLEVSAPGTISARNGGTVTYYEAVGDTVISHDPASNERQYVITYHVYDQEKPYQWSIRLVNGADGKILQTEEKEIPAQGSNSYDVESIIEVNGVNYILDAGMQKRYEHHYGENRILNIYYNEEGVDAVSSYNLNITYKSVSTDAKLFEATQTVTPDQNAVIDAPSEYAAENTRFVKLAGQEDVITHEFYNPRRAYTIYYRDVNDLQNVDTIVTQEEIVTIDNPVLETTPAGDDGAADNAAAAPTTQLTVLTNETTGEQRTLTDEGVPLANTKLDSGSDKDEKSLKDEETPKGKVGLLAAAADHPVTSGLILALTLAFAGALAVFYRKKNEKKEAAAAEGTGGPAVIGADAIKEAGADPDRNTQASVKEIEVENIIAEDITDTIQDIADQDR